MAHFTRRQAVAEVVTAIGQSRRIAQLLQKNPQQAALVQALSSVDESWTYTELAQQLEHSYDAQDRIAAKLIQREAIRTGIFIAASPYPLLDFLLVAWRNVAMVERVALIYHLKLSTPARWHLYQMIFVPETQPLVDRNIGKMVIEAVRSKTHS
ncbi:MAG: hypothetical protein B7Y53_03760 [Halothiobacillus sp. 28-55-5]|nr:MAG: hypothetical protein B7Y53_03760 [Halothiobacillus sp. 28-55-5]